jgi:hypothetical protein
MPRVPARILICALTVHSAFAGLNHNKAKYVGGTAATLPQVFTLELFPGWGQTARNVPKAPVSGVNECIDCHQLT